MSFHRWCKSTIIKWSWNMFSNLWEIFKTQEYRKGQFLAWLTSWIILVELMVRWRYPTFIIFILNRFLRRRTRAFQRIWRPNKKTRPKLYKSDHISICWVDFQRTGGYLRQVFARKFIRSAGTWDDKGMSFWSNDFCQYSSIWILIILYWDPDHGWFGQDSSVCQTRFYSKYWTSSIHFGNNCLFHNSH